MKKKFWMPLVLSACFLLGSCGASSEESSSFSSSASSSTRQVYESFTLSAPSLAEMANNGIKCDYTLSPAISLASDPTFKVYEEGQSTASSRLSFTKQGYLFSTEAGEFSFHVVCEYGVSEVISSNAVSIKIYPSSSENPDNINWADLRLGYRYFDDNSTSLHRYSYVIDDASKAFIQDDGNGGLEIIGVGMGNVEVHDAISGKVTSHRFVIANTLMATILRSLLHLEGQDLTADDLAKVKELSIDTQLQADPQMALAVRVLPNLEKLSLTNCGLTNIYFIKELKHLAYLDFTSNSISDIDFLKDFSSTLKEVHFAHNQIRDVAEAFQYYPHDSLTVADFSYNNLSSCAGFNSVFSLTSLELSGNPISDINGLGSLLHLSHLGVAYTNLKLGTVMSFTYLSNLEYLDISGVKEVNLSLLKTGLTHLVTFKMADCAISDYSASTGLVSFLLGYSNLSELAIGGNGVDDTALGNIASLVKLTSLDLTNSPFTGDLTQGPHTLKELTALTSLTLKNCHNLTNVNLFNGVKGLASLNLAGCYSLESLSFIQNNPDLVTLHMENTLNLLTSGDWTLLLERLGTDIAAPKMQIYLFEGSLLHLNEYHFYANYEAFKQDCLQEDNSHKLTFRGTDKKLIVSFVNEDYNDDKWWSPAAVIDYPQSVIEVTYVVKYGHYADSFTTETLDRSNDFTVNFISNSMRWGRDNYENFVYYHGTGTLNIGIYGAEHRYYTPEIYIADRPRAADNTAGGIGTMGYAPFRSQGGMCLNIAADTTIKGNHGGKGQHGGVITTFGPGQRGPDGGRGGTGGFGLQADQGPILVRCLHGATVEILGGEGGEGGEPDGGTIGGSAGSYGAKGEEGKPANQTLKITNII